MLNLLFLNANSLNKKLWLLIAVISLLILIGHNSHSVAQDYSVSSIPDNLKSSAKAVIRLKETELELLSENRLKLSERIAITILNEKGLEASYFIKHYDEFCRVRNISGTVYDSQGKRIKRIKAENILDISNISSNSTFVDNRMKYIDPDQVKTPFTVVYSYDMVYSDILDYPDFYLMGDFDIAVEQAKYTIRSSNEDGFRYREMNLPEGCKSIVNEDEISWTFSNVGIVPEERLGPSFAEIIPSIQVSPNSFKLEGRKGNSSTWEGFGEWIYGLNEGRNTLKEESIVEIKSLIKDESDTLAIIRKLYEYMQNNTRYVSIQIGIGGWQPFPAETVDRLGYGDCKALTNYMQAIYDVAGIPTYYTLVRAGKTARPLMTTFPSNQFNHAILCVPLEKDTFWLECTSQSMPCGSKSSFTDDRNVLLITKNGGEIARTPSFSALENSQLRNISVLLDVQGNGKAKIKTLGTGLKYEYLSHWMRKDKEDQRKYVVESTAVHDFELLDYNFKENRSMSPSVLLTLNLEMRQYGKFVGDKMLVCLNLMSVMESVPYESHRRQSDICIHRSSLENDSVQYELPKGYKVKSLPKPKSIISTFGEYTSLVELTPNGFLYTRNVEFFKGNYPPELYNDFIDFTEKIAQADKQKISLIKTVP